MSPYVYVLNHAVASVTFRSGKNKIKHIILRRNFGRPGRWLHGFNWFGSEPRDVLTYFHSCCFRLWDTRAESHFFSPRSSRLSHHNGITFYLSNNNNRRHAQSVGEMFSKISNAMIYPSGEPPSCPNNNVSVDSNVVILIVICLIRYCTIHCRSYECILLLCQKRIARRRALDNASCSEKNSFLL